MPDDPAPGSPHAKADPDRLLRRITVVLLFVVASLFGYWYVATRYADTDMFWHLATGRWILENGAIPTTDVFSWWGIANHRSWVPQGWLFDVGAYGLYALGKYTAVYVGVGLLEGALAVLFFTVARLRGLSTLWASLLTFVSLLGTLDYVVARPQIVTYCLLLACVVLLEKKRFFWALPIIAVGVNVHGGMWVVYLAVYALYAWPERWKWIAGALVAAGINPQPFATYAYPFMAYGSASTKQILEYAPTALWSLGASFWTYFVVFVLVMLRRVRIPWKEGAFCLALVVLGLTGVRHVVWMYVLVVPILAPYLVLTAETLAREALERFAGWRAAHKPAAGSQPKFWEETGGDETAADTTETVTAAADVPGRRPGAQIRIEALMALVLALASVGFLWADVTASYDPESYYPVAMVQYLQEHDITKIYTSYNEGGFLIFKGYQPLLDGRFDPFVAHYAGDLDIFSDYLAVGSFRMDMGFFLRKYGITKLMMPSDELALLLQQNPAFVGIASTKTHVLMEYRVELDRSAPGYVDPSKAATGSATVTSTAPATGTLPATTAP
jgi:hypothetical protein